MNLSGLIQRGLFYLSVPTCVCCKSALRPEEKAICDDCRASYNMMKERACSNCFLPLSSCSCPNDRLERHFVHRLIKVSRYIKRDTLLPSNALVYSLKKDYREDVFSFMADELTESIRTSNIDTDGAVFTHVPRRKSAIRHFGYDHAAILSKYLAKRIGAQHASFFVSRAKHAQKEMVDIERMKNASVHLRYRYRHTDLTGKRVFLLDDIVTTGASMSAAAMQLRAMGAKEIIGVCFAIAYLDA